MIRHFQHDIVKQNVYTDLDSFIKAMKYLERSIDALKKNFGVEPDPAYRKLSEFAIALTKIKKGKAGEQVELIREYFKSIEQSFPYEIKLGPENQYGQNRVEVEAKEKVIKDFWADCTKAMWSNVSKGIDLKIKDLNAKMAGVQSEAQARELHGKLEKIREMMEIEYHVLQDSEVGLKKLPDSFHSQMKEFRSVFKAFMNKWGIKIADIKTQQTFKFIEEMLKGDMICDASEVFVLHETGEAFEDDYHDDWLEILSSGLDKASELYLRGIKDIRADTSLMGPLRAIIEKQSRPRLSFFLGFLDGIRREAFSGIMEAFQRFVESGDWSFIEDARRAGYRRSGELQSGAIDIWRTSRDGVELAKYIRDAFLKPGRGRG